MSNIGLFDTHAHFSRASGDYRISEQVRRAFDAGVRQIVAVGGSDELNQAALDAASAYPDAIGVTLGFDRDCAEDFSGGDGADMASASVAGLLDKAKETGAAVYGIGEIGLDYHYSEESAADQVALFRCQLELARQLKLPVVVHSREADDDTLEALGEHVAAWQGDTDRIGVLHCYTGGAAFADELLSLGFYISFSGIVTFRNADPLRAVACNIPDERILIETDAPYLAPVPMRGQRNEPAFIEYTARCLADIRGVALDDFTQLTFRNADRLFHGRN